MTRVSELMLKMKYSNKQFYEKIVVTLTNQDGKFKNILIIQTNKDVSFVNFHLLFRVYF